MANPSTALIEHCWALLGQRRGRIWYARRNNHSRGSNTRVEFDADTVIDREERRRDVIGFLHTHPHTEARPSRRDVDTMRAWVGSFGKPMLCLIEGVDGLAGFVFHDDESSGDRLLLVEKFPRGIVIGVEADGG